MARVVARNYRIIRRYPKSKAVSLGVDLPASRVEWNFIAGIADRKEQVAVLQNVLTRFISAYQDRGGCRLPSCPCIAHKLGLPPGDILLSILPTKHR